MFYLSADKCKLSVLQKGIITSGSVNVFDVKFQFDSDWEGMEQRIAVFRVGSVRVSVVLDDTNQCKVPWECLRENDIGKELQIGVYGMIGETVILPTVWASLGNIKEGTRLGDSALPPSPSVAEQILAQMIAVRDEILAAMGGNPGDAGGNPGDAGGNEEEPGGDDPGTDSEVPDNDEVASDDEVSDALDDIFG